MNWSSAWVWLEITSTCTDYMAVTITVPSAGTVVINAWQYVILEHTLGTATIVYTKISTSNDDCGWDEWLGVTGADFGSPSDYYPQLYSLQRMDNVTAGTYTYYVNAVMVSGQSVDDQFGHGNMVAVFYPS